VADAGVTETLADDSSVKFAVAFLVLLAMLVAVTLTVCCEGTDVGAVYTPLAEIAPTVGLIDQLTDVFVVPLTEALSCWELAGATVAEVGDTEILTTGLMITLALADLPIEELVTVTVTVV
jgi:hypothetical protein